MEHQIDIRSPEDGQLTLAFEPSGKVVALYQVSITAYENGHVCARLQHLDSRTRRLIPETLVCSATGVVTRVACLTELLAATADALVDAEDAAR